MQYCRSLKDFCHLLFVLCAHLSLLLLQARPVTCFFRRPVYHPPCVSIETPQFIEISSKIILLRSAGQALTRVCIRPSLRNRKNEVMKSRTSQQLASDSRIRSSSSSTQISVFGPGIRLQGADNQALPAKLTTYYILSMALSHVEKQ